MRSFDSVREFMLSADKIFKILDSLKEVNKSFKMQVDKIRSESLARTMSSKKATLSDIE